MGLKISKCFSFKSQPKVFKLVLNSTPNYFGEFWKFEFPIVNDFLSKILNLPLYAKEKPKILIIWKNNGRRAKKEWYLAFTGSNLIYMGSFRLVAFNVFLRSMYALATFAKYDFQNAAASSTLFFYSQFLLRPSTQSYFLEFWNLEFKEIEKQMLKLSIVANGKMKNGKCLGNV